MAAPPDPPSLQHTTCACSRTHVTHALLPARACAHAHVGAGTALSCLQPAGAGGTVQLANYLAALAAVAVHLWYGWSKTVLKMAVDKEQRAAFVVLGHALIWPLVGGFALGPLYVWGAQQPALAPLLPSVMQLSGA